MLLEIDHHSGVPIYRQIKDQVREQIMAGRLKEGEQLVSVRELAAQLKVTPVTISKAYSAMETEGLLERRRGIGLFIAEIHSDKKKQTKESIIETLLSKAVTTAIQFGVSQNKLEKMLKDMFSKFQKEHGRESNE
jgi:GntR family transcriptional regulator